MCLHSRMGNNNWLKQSLLWENKRPGSVAAEGQAWWHSKHLNSHWLLGRWRVLSTSWSLPGRDRFMQLLGLGVRMLFHSHLLPLGLQSHLFPLQCCGISLTPVLHVLTAWNQKRQCSSVPGTVYSSSSEHLHCGPDECLMRWCACRGTMPTPAMGMRAMALWPSSCRTHCWSGKQ